MTTGRAQHAATLLADGKVLIAGGFGSSDTPSSAELYDPVSDQFSTTGSMTTGRSEQTATLLPNGKALIAGGVEWGGDGIPPAAVDSAELYDPVSGQFSATGSMSTEAN